MNDEHRTGHMPPDEPKGWGPYSEHDNPHYGEGHHAPKEKGWDWRLGQRMPNGELLTPREDVQKEWEPFFTPPLIVAFFALFAVIIVAASLRGGSFASEDQSGADEKSHSSHRSGAAEKSQEVSAEKSIAYAHKHGITNADIRGPYTIADGSIGSPQFYGGNESRLMNGFTRDSTLWINDGRPDGITAIIYTYGCGRGWTKIDKNGFQSGPGTRYTGCNMQFHQTGQKSPSTGQEAFGPPNYHGL
jgi:hypothetical protein